MAESVVSFVVDRLSELLIQEVALLRGVEDQVEYVERELRMMYAVLEHLEDSEGSSEFVNHLDDETREIALYAENLIETVVTKSGPNRRRGIFKWLPELLDQHKLGKGLNRVEVRIHAIHDVFKNRKAYDTGNHSWGRKVPEQIVTVEEENVLLKTITIVSSVIDKVNDMLSRKFFIHPGVIKFVECMRDELTQTHSFLKDMEPAGELDERERVWVEDVSYICCLANDAFESFIRKREPWMKRWLLFRHRVQDLKFITKMDQIEMKFRDHYDRKWTYGIGEFEGREGSISRFRSIWQRRQVESIRRYSSQREDNGSFISFIDSLISRRSLVESLVMGSISTQLVLRPLWPSLDSQVESIRRDLRLMDALFKDVGGMEDLDERVKVWLEQMRDVKSEANVLVNYFCQARQEKMKGVLKRIGNLRSRWKDERKIQLFNSKIRDISERKWAYDIKILRRKRGMRSMVQNLQEMAPSTSDNVGINNLYEAPPGSSQQYTVGKPNNSWIGEQVKSIREELKLLHALFEDFEAMEEPNERMKVWVAEMRDVADDAKAFIRTYENDIQKKGGGIIKSHVLICSGLKTQCKVEEEIYRIRSRICDISERKMIYDIGGIKGRRGQSSLAQNLPETGPATSESIERCDNQNRERRYIVKKMISFIVTRFTSGLSLSDLEGQVKSIQNEVNVIAALCQDVQSIAEQDRRLRIWLEEMRVVARDAEGVVDNYHKKIKREDRGIFNMIVSSLEAMNARNEVAKEISRTRNKIQAMSEMRLIYGINFIKTREATNFMNQSPKQRRSPADKVEVRRIKASTLTDLQDQGPREEEYKDLPIYLKKCLNYFRLFPEDFEIPARRLITLWVAEGFVNQKMVDKEPPEVVAERYLSELIARNMVQVTKKKLDGKVKTCRLPRALRKLLLSKPKDAEPPQDHTNTTSKLSSRDHGIVRFADHINQKDGIFDHIHGDSTNISLQRHYRDVLSFLSFDTREGSEPGKDVGNFLRRCISSRCFLLLRVLDLERVFRPRLPKAIGKLSQLRYLGLRWTYLEKLPKFVSKLLKLQTLDVKHTYISTLPRSIWKMQQLRHLYLSESYRSRFVPRPSGGSLMDLQTLWGVFIDEKSPVWNGLNRLLNLRKLGLSCRVMSSQGEMSSQLVRVAHWVQNLEHLQYLRLRSHDELGRPWDLHLESLSHHVHLSSIYLLGRLKTESVLSELFPENLINLTLSASELNEDPLIALGKLPKLKILQLFAASYRGKKMHCVSGGFPELQVLKLWKLEELEEWNMEDGALPNLVDLEIRSCGRLKALPDGLQHVKTLRELKLSDMPKEFTARMEKGKARIGMNCYVYIHDWSFPGHAHLSSIYLLGRLKTPSVLSEFPENLAKLTLLASELVDDPMKTLGKLPKLKILQLSAASYRGKKMHCVSGGFRELHDLELWKLEELEEWNVEDGALPNLVDLKIGSCGRLKAFPDGLQHVKNISWDMPQESTARMEKGKAKIGMNSA